MGRPIGSNNIKESQRQKAVRLLAEGKTNDEVLSELVNSGSTAVTAKQYVQYATKQLTKGE